jgi:GT2 family glycosyltransferase/glycosyltransferase involved in cell wall biosynthesis
MPAFDRDSGSQDIDNIVQFLLRAGWRVTFIAREEEGVAEARHAHRLREMGVETHAGFDVVDQLLQSNDFDVAIVAFWELARELLPKLRSASPATRVIVNSVDVHFLRTARHQFGKGGELDAAFGTETAAELNTYNEADAVIAVSEKERDLLADFIGEDRVFHVPIAESITRSAYPLERRRGIYFVGNFRHVPNREAVEYMCGDVLPLLDPNLLRNHPFTVIGNWLDQVTLDVDPSTPGLKLVGWVPSVVPYIEHSRIGVVPLLHGAGVKRKVIQSLMAGTPVVTTHVGAEGLDLVQGRHALIATDTDDLASGITRLLTDDALWQQTAEHGAAYIEQRHGFEVAERNFSEVIERLVRRPSRAISRDTDSRINGAIERRVQTIARPGDVVLVAAAEALDEIKSFECWPFPQDREGASGYEPANSDAAINHFEAQRLQGARYFVLPKNAFTWRQKYAEFIDHVESRYTRLFADEQLALYDLIDRASNILALAPIDGMRVHVIGTYAARRTGPPSSLREELSSSEHLELSQDWHSDAEDAEPRDEDSSADYVVYVGDNAILPSHFLDTLIATQLTLDAERLQPTHRSGPGAGPPVTERHLGSVAREIDDVTDIPVLAVRAGSAPTGRVALADNIAIGIRDPLPQSSHEAWVRRTWIARPGDRPACFERAEPDEAPRISVLIATYDRPELLRACLESFATQTLDRDAYEIVVVDDGSPADHLTSLIDAFSPELQITGLRIEHGGRSAAKNHAVFQARAPLVLFFDDDDRATPDYLERHLAMHAAHPSEGVAVLGHTSWAPELERTPLMHYITDVDRLMFAYDRLRHGQELDWRGFWEGRISCKRSLLVRHGLHDQRLPYSIDIEMGWRVAPAGLRVVYDSTARSLMARPLDFDAFCERTEAKGRAHATIAALHAGTEIAKRLDVHDAVEVWHERGGTEQALRARVRDLEARISTDRGVLQELHAAYREVFKLLHVKGAALPASRRADNSSRAPSTKPFAIENPPLVENRTPPQWRGEPLLSITVPVWSHTPELAEMARQTIERIWEVARVPTEVVVIDNGSPYPIPLAAKVYRYPENRGVSTGWNTGIRLSTAPVVVVLNSDCKVEPGWDQALYEAVHDGRRIAFPYTDHCDGLGFVCPDQAGTAGWCFMLTQDIYRELGPFDEWFSPAFCEDTDYWHRAWERGIDLSPVPAAHVVHARRTSSQARSDLLLQAHRFKYGWKHNVDPLRAPPYYKREVVDYVGSLRAANSGSDATRPERPRIFGIGLNKTATTSLHHALTVLGFESLHWGGPAVRRIVEICLDAGEPLLSRIDPRFDAFCDILPLSQNYQVLAEQYPGSRFILTVRSLDEWIESRRRHVETNRRRRDAGQYSGNFLTVDEETWRQEWKSHVEQVRSFFDGRNDLLELDLSSSPEWQPLCRFLGVPEPTEPFPWANRGRGDVTH